ncbi:protein-(glutamine-N5) methyltransferase, release factor-specific [Psychrobacter sp. C 20.9]|uniref:peptide chain release factor N(5)-glutamine methyltransferase n=1 Tax=Psychrobacter sp. C 20.9 TaxID=1926477 RepID=UPI0009468E55|nr:peptide chain release factor N(5)-glutamine methyltransferase [Psychrobacter sp. C 20.9]OLF37783.1 protein-(glutamine-N5) methyltransferase, release factor-specific [Psychrobacter sp. C 20.9]
MTALTIRQIKQQIGQLTNGETNRQIPSFWPTDWLLYVIDKPSLFLITDEDYQLTESELAQFNAGVAKMQQGIPLAYLTGQQEFWSLNFVVNEHTLIPRPDTEVLVEQVLKWINAQPVSNPHKRLLDLGTGSGCIAASLAHELKKDNWQVVAVDLSLEALDIARHNADINGVTNIEFIQSSWYQALPTEDECRFDVIVSNPPYIDEADEHLAGLTAEPISALSAPNHGLADIEHIVQQAPSYLSKKGLLAIEHGHDQGVAVRRLFLENGFESVHTVQDYGGNDRVTVGQYP